jgi:hypothetical protein
MLVDNTPMQYRFKDGNPLSDGMAAFAASVINAGPAAAQIRQQRERDAVADAFRAADDARANRALDLQSLWHSQARDMDLAKAGAYQGDDVSLQDIARQVKLAGAARDQLAQAQIDSLKAANARAAIGQFGEGMNEAAKRTIDVMKLFFSGGRRIGTGSGLEPIKLRDADGTERIYALDPSTKRLVEYTVQDPTAPVNGTGKKTAQEQTGTGTDMGEQTGRIDRAAQERFPFAIERVNKTITEMRARMAATTSETQRGVILTEMKALADLVNAAKGGDEQAIRDLLEADAAQPDTIQRDMEDRQSALEHDAAIQALR